MPIEWLQVLRDALHAEYGWDQPRIATLATTATVIMPSTQIVLGRRGRIVLATWREVAADPFMATGPSSVIENWVHPGRRPGWRGPQSFGAGV